MDADYRIRLVSIEMPALAMLVSLIIVRRTGFLGKAVVVRKYDRC